jgi:hypothetical protein
MNFPPYDNDPNYWLDNYGECKLGAAWCTCLRNEWLGQGCLHWKPWGVKSFDDLQEMTRVEMLKAKSG